MRMLLTVLVLAVLATPSKADFLLGVSTHVSPHEADSARHALESLRVNSIRQDLPWKHVEKEKGKYQAGNVPSLPFFASMAATGISPLLILDYGNQFYDGGGKPVSREGIDAYARYAFRAVKDTGGTASIYEIWNEWDHSSGPESAVSYFDVVKATAPAIKAANLDAVVLAGAATTAAMRKGWVEELVRLGVMKYVDGISIHPYIHCDRDKSPEAWVRLLAAFSSRLQKANGGRVVPIYLSEMGWPSHIGACGTPTEMVGNYLARALLLVRTLPEVKGLWWYDLKDDGRDRSEREQNFGLLTFDYAPKPAFAALQDLAPLVSKARSVERQMRANGIEVVLITGADGKKSVALWSENERPVRATLALTRDNRFPTRLLKVGSGNSLPVGSDRLNLTIDGTPLIISGIAGYTLQR